MGKRKHKESDKPEDDHNEQQQPPRKLKRREVEVPKRMRGRGTPITADVPSLMQHKEHETALSEDVFFNKRLVLTVSLPPSALRNVRRGLDDCLRSLLLTYSDGVGGIMIAYRNIQMNDGGKGRILNELPYIHYEINVEALVFCPMTGSIIKGAVTESFNSHLSLVVLHYFNASIPADSLQEAGFFFDSAQEQWTNKKDVTLHKGDWIQFECSKVHESVGVISLSGTRPCICLAH